MHQAPKPRPRATAYRPHARFEIHAEPCPQLIPRVVGLFAAQALIPSDLRARRSCAGLWLSLEVDVEPDKAHRLAEKLKAIGAVEAVILICLPEQGD